MTRSERPRRPLLSIAAGAVAFALTAVLAAASPAAAREDPPTWTPVQASGEQTQLGLSADADVAAFDVDLGSVLQSSSKRSTLRTMSESPSSTPTHLSLPDPTGAFVDFVVEPVSVMEQGLAARHPELQTFAGRAESDPTVTVRVSLTPLGLSASVRSGDNRSVAWYIDPLPSDAGSPKPRHISYGRDVARDSKAGAQFLEPDEDPVVEPQSPADTTAHRQIIRLAFASDPSFAQFYGTENVLAAKVTMVTRIAQIYNDDLGVQLRLIDDTDKLNFDSDAAAYSPGGECGDEACYPAGSLSECSGDTLTANASALQRILGDDAYDVGHVSLGSGDGGIAYLNVVGVEYWKGGGCTGLANPIGDVFATDYVAHELGHQFGGTHTMNACHNMDDSTALEPGSSSTIMGYAGLCGANNLQSNSDPYFSAFSIDQMHAASGWAGVHEATTNSVPQVNAPESRTVPIRTPFQLTATGADPDGDPLTYVWEQANVGDQGRSLHDANKLNGPLFRVFSRAADLTFEQAHSYYSGAHNAAEPTPTRVFPDMDQILRGATNARTGDCDLPDWRDERDCFSEFLPTSVYEGNGTGGFDFRVTARDQRADGGGVAMANVHLSIARDAGPFEVTSLSESGQTVDGGRAQDITWNVNGTDAADLAPEVRISLSLDGGKTFDQVLAERTANDGAETVTLPNVSAEKARIKIEAVDNYFFAVNGADFAIQDTVLQSVQPQAVRTVPGEPVELPSTVVPVYTNGVRPAVPVTWDASGIDWSTAGSYRVIGSGVDAFGTAFSNAVLTVEIGDFRSTDPVSITVPVGIPISMLADLLPDTVPAQVGTGESRFPTAVTWNTDAIAAADVDAVGSFRVDGAAAPAISGAPALPARATVIVTEASPVNVAPDSTSRTASFTEPGYSIEGTVNGDLGDKAWSNWKGDGFNASDTLTYTWPTPQLLDTVVLSAFRDGGATSWPTQVAVSYVDALTGQRVTTAPVAVDATAPTPVATVALADGGRPALTSSIEVEMTSAADSWITISEVQAFARRASVASVATLARVNVDGVAVEGFDPATLRYDVTVDGSRWPVVSAVATDDEATVSIGAVDTATGRIAIDVTAADGTTTQTYEVVVTQRATDAESASPAPAGSGSGVTGAGAQAAASGRLSATGIPSTAPAVGVAALLLALGVGTLVAVRLRRRGRFAAVVTPARD